MTSDYKSPGSLKKCAVALVKPAGGDCNLDCAYCFYKSDHAPGGGSPAPRMAGGVLKRLVRGMLEQADGYASFIWQGGEPTLMGLDFYEKAVSYQHRYGKGVVISNGLQTNGILLTASWADFLRENRFLVGLSIDGPAHIHDRYRRFSGDEPSFSRVRNRLEMLLERQVAVNAVSVVNAYSARFPEEIYNFHKQNRIQYMQFIPCVESDPSDRSRAASFSVSGERYGRFLRRVFDCWKADFKFGFPTVSVRLFDSLLHRFAGMEAPDCTLMDECGVYLTVDYDGSVYPCDFFVSPEWRLGHLETSAIGALFNSARQTRFGKMKTELPSPCPDCRWLAFCRGGCLKDRIRDPRDRGLSHFCGAMKSFLDYAAPHFRRLAKRVAQQAGKAPGGGACRQGPAFQKKAGRNAPCPCGSGLKYKKCCG